MECFISRYWTSLFYRIGFQAIGKFLYWRKKEEIYFTKLSCSMNKITSHLFLPFSTPFNLSLVAVVLTFSAASTKKTLFKNNLWIFNLHIGRGVQSNSKSAFRYRKSTNFLGVPVGPQNRKSAKFSWLILKSQIRISIKYCTKQYPKRPKVLKG
jgi:hypothetical protein